MADRPKDPEDRGYGWLYGNEDEEQTRRIPTSRGDRHGAAARPGDDQDPTRMMPVRGRGTSAAGQRQRPARPSTPPPPRRGGSRRGSRPGVRRRWGRIVLLALLLWLVFLVAVPIWALSKIEEVDAEPDDERPGNTMGSTYLMVGSDSREGLTRRERRQLATGNVSGQRTDTILLLHEPLFGGETLLISLPRDSIVDVPGYGEEKLNAAFSFGGPELLVRTVENETGLRVDNYVEVGLGGFVNVVDAVGGVQICPKTKMNDPKAGLNIEKGCQEADGATALGYVRTRQYGGTGDIARGDRQRQVIAQVANKAASPWTVLNPLRYVAVNSAGADALRVGENVGPIDLARFAWAVRKVSGGDGKTCTVPIADLAVTWDDERASELFDRIQEGETDDIGRRLCSKTGLPR